MHNVPFFISMYKYTFILKKQNKCINSSLQLEYFQIIDILDIYINHQTKITFSYSTFLKLYKLHYKFIYICYLQNLL